MKIFTIFLAAYLFSGTACSTPEHSRNNVRAAETDTIPKVRKSNLEWKDLLPPETYNVMRKNGTERPYSGKYWNNHQPGYYVCAACGLYLFDSETKFESGCGWPSFYDVTKQANVIEVEDLSHGMRRTEIRCARCNGHLGHVFNDGPPPTGLRYCINSAALIFHERKNEPAKE